MFTVTSVCAREQPIDGVTIGMPTYNSAKFVDQAINSVRKQSFTNFKLIISDNCSADETLSICKTHAKMDPRIEIVSHSQNWGAVKNFQSILNIAQTSLFCWMGSDDIWSVDWLSSLVSALNERDVIGAFGRVVQIDSESLEVIEHPANGAYFPWSEIDSAPFRVGTFLTTHPRRGRANMIYGLFRADFLLAASQDFFLEANKSSDNDVVRDLLQRGPIASCPEAVLFKRLQTPQFKSRHQLVKRVNVGATQRLRRWKEYRQGTKLLDT